ncbi:MAG: hypothetical protein DLM53_06565 [Candidatus Eremiobacter antarcticus]|nr:hypothetical protein [Candidatus Eremiobacteraeota bacterium]MBC5808644.1 hypothetical protein [Candidatus Eremiobacteraeota bacterium]PZR62136.1 MAG: hypothetical protein DLM53_06565 [Candidatus Eremiobacter sp. RRmetagenome_bin22]
MVHRQLGWRRETGRATHWGALIVCSALLTLMPLGASAKGGAFDVRPPGDTMQKIPMTLGPGRAANFVAIVSREYLQSAGRSSRPRFQPYFSLYRSVAGPAPLRRVYVSPSGSDPLKLVPRMQRIPNAPGVWMPGYVDVRIVGSAPLMQSGASQLVIRVYSSAADCGSATVHVLALGARDGRLHDVVQAQNYCRLEAALQPGGVALRGPYYADNAALCCPTKTKASAFLRYDRKNRTWVIAPKYFRLFPAGMP